MRRIVQAMFALLLGGGVLFAAEQDPSLVARWTFDNGSLKSDVGGFEFQEGNGGFLEVGQSAVTLAGSKVLFCAEISAAMPSELQNNITLWVRVKFDELPKEGELGVMGLQTGTAAGWWPALVFSLLYRPMSDVPEHAGLGFLARAQGSGELGVGSELFQSVPPGEFAEVAIVFNGPEHSASMWVSRTGQWVESKREGATALEKFDALLIGKLITPGAETAVTFDEVRVYSAALDARRLEEITTEKN